MITESGLITSLKAHLVKAGKDLAVKTVREALVPLSNDARFQQAIKEDSEQLLFDLLEVMIAVARGISGQNLDGEQAKELLLQLATDPQTRRRFKALYTEAAVSEAERVAMLAAGYFAGGQPVAIRDRLDWALRGLFPEDARTLRMILENLPDATSDEHLVALDIVGSETNLTLRRANGAGLTSQLNVGVSAESLRALASVRCIEMADGIGRIGARTFIGMPAGVQRAQAVQVLPLGHELHGALRIVDWEAISRARRGPS